MRKISLILRTISVSIIMVFILFAFIPSILGFRPIINLVSAMKEVPKGSLAYINKHAKYNEIKEKDIIAINVYKQEMITRVVKINGNKTMLVKGDDENDNSTITITKNNYIGKKVLSIPKVGSFLYVFENNFYITIILFLMLIVSIIMDYDHLKQLALEKTQSLTKTIAKILIPQVNDADINSIEEDNSVPVMINSEPVEETKEEIPIVTEDTEQKEKNEDIHLVERVVLKKTTTILQTSNVETLDLEEKNKKD